LKIYFKNSCKGFAFSSKWVGERICVGKEWGNNYFNRWHRLHMRV
jgi:hypothetical protein